MNETKLPILTDPPPPSFPSPAQRARGFFRASALSYAAGGSTWAVIGLLGKLDEDRLDSALTFAYLGFTYAGAVHLATSALPAALLWAFLTPESSLTRLGPALFVGFLLGTLAGLIFGTWAPVVGLVYGMPTAAIHLATYRHLQAAHGPRLPPNVRPLVL